MMTVTNVNISITTANPLDEEKWGDAHDGMVDLMKNTDCSEAILQEAISHIKDKIDASHRFRDTLFNLLFHAIMSENKLAFGMLLRAGADPLWENDRGTNLLHMLVKRDFTEWGDLCLEVIGVERKSR